MRNTLAAAICLLLAGAAAAGPQLIPAQPQPVDLKPGLSVVYAYPPDIRDLGQAALALRDDPQPGLPLAGLDYPDTRVGEAALTSRRSERVAAAIDGFLHFDEPGTWRLQFHSNDGVQVKLGQMRIYTDDGRFPCRTSGWVNVEIPVAGWYPLEAMWFQRFGTSCLMLRRQSPAGVQAWTSVEDYGFVPE